MKARTHLIVAVVVVVVVVVAFGGWAGDGGRGIMEGQEPGGERGLRRREWGLEFDGGGFDS